MHSLVTILNLMSAVAALLAAWFWYCSARVNYPPTLTGWVVMEDVPYVDTEPFIAAAQKSARLNKLAAGWSATVALLVAVSAIIEQIP